jgi:hypothetical protein
MYKLNKIRAHIQMLEFEQRKLNMYLNEEEAKPKRDDQRIKDIMRALRRVTDNIGMWNAKITAFENATPDAPPRDPIDGSGLGGPLI